MCGRYALTYSPDEIAEEFGADRIDVAERIEPSWNVAPTDQVYGVMVRPRRDDRDVMERRVRGLRWGLVPSWAKDVKIGARMINARLETVASKPAFKRAFERRRCLLPANGYFEWYGEGKAKQPFFIRPRDGGVLAMAGLYEIWRDPEVADDDDPAAFVWTSTVITTEAEDDVGQIHDRMPMHVEPERWSDWLDPARAGDALLELLVPAAPGLLEAYPVSPDVGNVRNNGAYLIEPLPADNDSAALF
ncbi:MAG TPA: SOS response-associated peptidase [Jiangellaceae bacterium]